MLQENLRSFNLARLKELRKKIKPYGAYKEFFDELEIVLRCKHPKKSCIWTKMEKNDIILGDVYNQYIGEYYHKHTVHRFTYHCVTTKGLAIAMHGHNEPVKAGKQFRKVKEWYIFPNGQIAFCDKDKMHQLTNPSNEPMYVLSIKVCSNGLQ